MTAFVHISIYQCTQGCRQRTAWTADITVYSLDSGILNFFFIHFLYLLDVCNRHLLLIFLQRHNKAMLKVLPFTSNIKTNDSGISKADYYIHANNPRSFAPQQLTYLTQQVIWNLLLLLRSIPMLEVGTAKHSPEESRILCGPPQESNHPVQYSITILGWTPWSPWNEKLAGQKRQIEGIHSWGICQPQSPANSSLATHPWPERPLKAEHNEDKCTCTRLASTCGFHTAGGE